MALQTHYKQLDEYRVSSIHNVVMGAYIFADEPTRERYAIFNEKGGYSSLYHVDTLDECIEVFEMCKNGIEPDLF